MTRPIDADILKEAINTWDKFACSPNGELVPFRNLEHPEMFEPYIHFRDVIKAIDNAPTIPLPDFKDGYKQAILDGKTNYSRQQEWIPIKTRPLTEEEKEEYPDYSFMYDCHLPDDGEEVLVTTSSGMVTLDTFYRDDGCYFECYCDEGDVLAWQPLPEPYKGTDNE